MAKSSISLAIFLGLTHISMKALYMELYPFISEGSERSPSQIEYGARLQKIINSDQSLKHKTKLITAKTIAKFFEEIGVELDVHATQPPLEALTTSSSLTSLQNGSSILRALKQPLSDSVLFNSGVTAGGTVKGLSTFCRHILFPLYPLI
jgi:hypothetical protein